MKIQVLNDCADIKSNEISKIYETLLPVNLTLLYSLKK